MPPPRVTMDHSHRPRVSRETRLLLTTALVALAVLWGLARLRFPERPATPNPVQPLLTQLAATPAFDDLASAIADLQARLEPSLVALELPEPEEGGTAAAASTHVAALRIRDDVVAALLPAQRTASAAEIVASDPASGLAVVRVAASTAPQLTPWAPQRLQQPRYLIASDVSARGVSLRPVFISALHPVDSAIWAEPIWTLPSRADLAPGTFVFTADAALAGLVTEHDRGVAIVPGSLVLDAAGRLLERTPAAPGEIGIEVQALTPSISAATGATAGVVVTWIAPESAAAAQLGVGEVIEAIDGRAVQGLAHWRARMARLAAGDTLALRVRQGEGLRDVQLTAIAPAAPAAGRPVLGLVMRRLPGLGAQVVRVDPASVAERAGLKAGDVVTLIADVEHPTPAEISRVFASAVQGRPLLVAVTRGDTHHVTTLAK